MGVSADNCKALIKDYCTNCTFAGVHFIADETKHWLERILWLFLVILSWYCSGVLIITAVNSYVANPISFVAETTYLNWETKMPAVAVCELMNDDELYKVSDILWTPQHLLDLVNVLKDIVYYKGVSAALVEICYKKENPDPNCPKSNYRYYVDLVRSDCQNFIVNCSFNGKQFNCCDYFLPIDTELGICYIINSIQTQNHNPNPFQMKCNRSNTRASLSFDVKLHSMVYTLGEDEVPTLTTLGSSTIRLQMGYNYKDGEDVESKPPLKPADFRKSNVLVVRIYHFGLDVPNSPMGITSIRRQLTIRSIENDPLIVQTTPAQRSCYFHDENRNDLYPFYSYSVCNVLCRKKSQVDLCGCNDHFMLGTNESERCNISGLACLHSYRFQLTTLKPFWSTRAGLSCSCLPSCDETEITVINEASVRTKGKTANKNKSHVEVVLAYLPTERFKRSVVRSRLDLVVSVGGTAGLFVGASLLSFVELIFFFTVRFASNVMMENRKRNSILIT